MNTHAQDRGHIRIGRRSTRIAAWAAGHKPHDPDRITYRDPPHAGARDVYVYFDNDEDEGTLHRAR